MNALAHRLTMVPRAVLDNDPPVSVQEALLDVLAEWSTQIPHSHRLRLASAIRAECQAQDRADMERIRAEDARAVQRPGWPVRRVFVDAEGRN